MSRAFVLLIWLRNVAGWRALWRRGRGSPIAMLGRFWILAVVLAAAIAWLSAVWRSLTSDPSDLFTVWLRSAVREGARMAPLPLLLFVLWTGILAAFEKPFRFSPTEVDFLCAGPFRRRQLVNYKLASALSSMVVVSLLVAAPSRAALSGFVPVFVGSLLLFIFMHLFAVVAGSVGGMLGLHSARGLLRLVLALALPLGVLAILWFRFGKSIENPIEIYRQSEQSLVWRAATSPMRWFVEATLAERIWPDLLQWSSLCLLVNGLLFVTVHVLDARLEGRAETDEVRANLAETLHPLPRQEPWAFPLFSRCRGLGPIAWRQCMNAIRSPQQLFLVLVAYGGLLLMLFALILVRSELLFLPTFGGQFEINPVGARVCGVLAFSLVMLVAATLSFDFRRDMGQIDVLKAIPIGPIALTAGQLFVPVVIACLMQWVAMVAAAIAFRSAAAWLWTAAAFVPPVSVVLAAIENLPAFWFPVSQTRGAKPDPFELIGHVVIHPLLRLVAYSAVVVVTLAVAAGAYFLFGQQMYAAFGAAWLTLAAIASGLVVLVAHAFDQFDVSSNASAEH